MSEVKLGCRARDKITGMTGIVVALTNWLNGCVRATIQPQELKDGVPVDTATFDIQQVEVLAAEEPASIETTGGPKPSPTRATDPV